MQRYLLDELLPAVAAGFPVDLQRCGVFGHSMGGHGALTLALKNPSVFRSCSAFAPIVSPSQVPWGQKALPRYLGEDRAAWRAYDATALVEDGHRFSGELLIDQGLDDKFLDAQLKPELFEAACARAGQALRLRRHAGYDHSYWFIQSFVEDHLRHHSAALNPGA
jgi:S-formylglutathione hydrolase